MSIASVLAATWMEPEGAAIARGLRRFLLRQPVQRSCPHCQAGVAEEFNFCPNCQFQLNPVCDHCQRALGAGHTYCAHCGSPVSERQQLLAVR